jgi:hypothetical protein
MLHATGRRHCREFWLEIQRSFRRFERRQESSIEGSIRQMGREIEPVRIFSGYDLTADVCEVSDKYFGFVRQAIS